MKLPESILSALKPPEAMRLEERAIPVVREEWIKFVDTHAPNNARYVRFVADTIVIRGIKLATDHKLDRTKICVFLFDKTLEMIALGAPVDKIIKMLPTTMRDLGAMKIVLDRDEVARKMGKKP